jgi:hypothetical protein
MVDRIRLLRRTLQLLVDSPSTAGPMVGLVNVPALLGQHAASRMFRAEDGRRLRP